MNSAKTQPVDAPDAATTVKRWPALRRWGVLFALLLTLLVVAAWMMRAPIAVWQAKADFERRNWEGAGQWLQRAESWSPSYAAAQFWLARLARKQGRMDEFGVRLARARDLGYSPDDIQREEWLAFAQQGRVENVLQHLETLLTDQRGDGNEICESYVQGFVQIRQFSGAQDLLKAWIADHPTNPQPLLMRSMIHQEFQHWDEAESDLRKVLKLDPNHGEAALSLGIVLLTKKMPEDALQFLEIAERDPAHHRDAVAGKIKCLHHLGRTDEAQKLAESLLAEDPTNLLAAGELARILNASGQYERAVKLLRPIVAAAPRHADYHYLLATALLASGHQDEGRELLARSQLLMAKMQLAHDLTEDITPDLSTIDDRFKVGMLHLEYGEEKEGLVWLFSVLNLDPNHRQTLTALANYYEGKSVKDGQYVELARQFRARLAAQNTDKPKASQPDTSAATPASDGLAQPSNRN